MAVSEADPDCDFPYVQHSEACIRADERAKIVAQWGGVNEYLMQMLRMIDALTLQIEGERARVLSSLSPAHRVGKQPSDRASWEYVGCRVDHWPHGASCERS